MPPDCPFCCCCCSSRMVWSAARWARRGISAAALGVLSSRTGYPRYEESPMLRFPLLFDPFRASHTPTGHVFPTPTCIHESPTSTTRHSRRNACEENPPRPITELRVTEPLPVIIKMSPLEKISFHGRRKRPPPFDLLLLTFSSRIPSALMLIPFLLPPLPLWIHTVFSPKTSASGRANALEMVNPRFSNISREHLLRLSLHSARASSCSSNNRLSQ
mmetsp:Transcript_14366/g.36098  ORF Transcript_14366/g.36098 Transcript_14366/m.36098 type:complete len:217 (-) Transcript_14366:453-1103(-)